MSRALSSAVEEPFSQVHVALHAANLCPSPDTQCEFKGLFLFVFPGITFRKARVQRHRTDWELGTPPGIISYLNLLVSLGQRSGATTQEPTARLTLPAQARFPQAVSRMGFCLLHSPQTAGFAHPGVTGVGLEEVAKDSRVHPPAPRRDQGPPRCFSERFPQILS